MIQEIKTIGRKGDPAFPAVQSLDSAFSIGQEISLVYYIHQKGIQYKGYISAFQPGGKRAVSRFLITDILACTLTTPPCVMLQLRALDPEFFLRYPPERETMLTELDVLSLLLADKNA